MLVVTVFFEMRPENVAEFKQAIFQNAAASLSGEAGRRQFDVCFSGDNRQCFLYEIYVDQAAFDAHLATAHFREFNRRTQQMVTDKVFNRYELVPNPFAQS